MNTNSIPFTEGMSVIKHNALNDPSYAPYCGPCPTLVRMKKIEHLYWRCEFCGAEHDEREPK